MGIIPRTIDAASKRAHTDNKGCKCFVQLWFPASQHVNSLEHGIFISAHTLDVGTIFVGTLVGDEATVRWTARLCASTVEIASVANIPW